MNKLIVRLLSSLGLAFVVQVTSVAGQAQAPQTPGQSAVLRPPAGAKVALIEFADLECPDCARADALLGEAVTTYRIPLVVYEFPLPQHAWAFDAAVYAQYFRTLNKRHKGIETKFRSYVYQNQAAINQQNLREYVDKFAAANKLAVPLAIDSKGTLAAAVRADRDKGVAANIRHTPTIFVVTATTSGTPFVEVVDRKDLFAMIERAGGVKKKK